MDKRAIDKIGDRIRWGYLIAFILLLISYLLSFYTNKKLLTESNWVNHTHKVINNLQLMMNNISDAESGTRGYIITGEPGFISNFKGNVRSADSLSSEIVFLTQDNSKQQQSLNLLKELSKRKFILLDNTIKIFNQNNKNINSTLQESNKAGKILMDSIRNTLNKMKAEENNLMNERSGSVVSFSHFINVINIASLIIAMVMIFYSLMTFNKENAAKREADMETLKYRDQLEVRVNELDKLNAELVELKSIEKFALTGRISRTIAHEVRNPLTNINLAVEQLRAELNSEDAVMLLDMISRNGTRINQLISDLLNSTRTNLLNFESRNLNDLLDESLRFAEDRIELKEIKVVKEYTDEVCMIDVDTQKINIAFLNIIVNACEAMEPKGILTIKTEKKNNKCFAYISDNGKGIDSENLSRLFEPYFTTKDNGTGLGLTNTQNIILSHKASIQADSIPGKGTKFQISFLCSET